MEHRSTFFCCYDFERSHVILYTCCVAPGLDKVLLKHIRFMKKHSNYTLCVCKHVSLVETRIFQYFKCTFVQLFLYISLET